VLSCFAPLPVSLKRRVGRCSVERSVQPISLTRFSRAIELAGGAQLLTILLRFVVLLSILGETMTAVSFSRFARLSQRLLGRALGLWRSAMFAVQSFDERAPSFVPVLPFRVVLRSLLVSVSLAHR
jgi:hypothetical protein